MRSPSHDHRHLHRRHFLKVVGGGTAASLIGAKAAFAAPVVPRTSWDALVDRARTALERHATEIRQRDRFIVVDFSQPSSLPRMLLVDEARGRKQMLRVAHGRGSDPDHSGWLRSFSNEPGSNASSRGAFVTGETYVGAHGRSQRLTGLEPTNNNAEPRAIVIHGAWYCNDDVLQRTGKLGRSEGCFAVSEATIDPLLEWLGPGRLLYADKV